MDTEKRHKNLHMLGSVIFFASIAIIGIIIHRLYGSLSLDTFQSFLHGMGWFGFFAYIFCYTIGIMFFVPAMALALVGSIMFGQWTGFLALQCSSMAAASAIFAMVRFGVSPILKKEESKNMIPQWIRKMGQDNGLLLLVYARTFMVPASVINYGVSALPITFSDFFIGTLLGSLPHNLAFALLFGVMHDAILKAKLSALLQWELIPALILTVLNVYLAHVLSRKKQADK